MASAGADEAAEGSQPTVSFVDQRPLAVKAEDLTKAGALRVEVHNDLGRPQKVVLRVVGPGESEDEGVQTFFVGTEAEQSVPAGGTATLSLAVTKTMPETEVESFEAILVAAGESGSLARRTATVSLAKEPATPKGGAGTNVLRPTQAVDVTLVAINFLPTLLSSATSFGFFLTLLLGLIGVVLARQLRRLHARLPHLLLAAALLVGTVTTVLLISSEEWGEPSLHAISSRPIPVSSGLGDAPVGIAASEAGTIAQIVLAGEEMRPQGLRGAASYKGTYDFTPGVDGGNAAAAIKVRDFWPYAVLAIMLGLYVAYRLRRWYERTRPSLKARSRLEGMHTAYKRRDDELRAAAGEGASYAGLSLDERLKKLSAEVERKLEESDHEGAAKLLDEMASYVEKYFRLWKALLSLDKSSAELMKRYEAHSFDLKSADLDGYFAARRLLAAAVQVTAPGQGPEALDAKLKEVEDQDGLVRAITRLLESVLRHLEATRSVMASPGSHEKELKALEGKLAKLGAKALQVGKLEELDKIESEDDDAVVELLQLVKTIKEETAPQLVRMSVGDTSLFRGLWISEVRGSDVQFLAALDAQPERPAPPTAEVKWARWRDPQPGEGKVHKGDEVEFTITLSPSPAQTVAQLEIEFGPDEKKRVAVPDAPGLRLVHVKHSYATGGSRNVTVRSLPGEEVLGTKAIEVDGETNVEEGQRDLSDYDRAVAAIAFVLAVASGMTALYLTDPSWGEPVDYLSALVWGGVAGEGVKLAAGIADRAFPGS